MNTTKLKVWFGIFLFAVLLTVLLVDHVRTWQEFAALAIIDLVAIVGVSLAWWNKVFPVIVLAVGVTVQTARAGEPFILVSQAPDLPPVILTSTNDSTVCEIVIGGVVLVLGSYALYKLWKCADKLTKHPTNAPPTNTDAMLPASPLALSASLSVAGLPPLDRDLTAPTNGWRDWLGNPITYTLAGILTNGLWSSPDLVHWSPEPVTVIGWVGGNEDTITTVASDMAGVAFATNWTVLRGLDPQTIIPVLTSSRAGVPVRPGIDRMFYHQ